MAHEITSHRSATERGTVTANGMELYYEADGDGPPLVLIMGLAAQLIDWTDTFVDALVQRGFRVIRFDNRDAGLSSQTSWEPPPRTQLLRNMLLRRRSHAGYGLSDMAADTFGLMDALGIDQAHIVGASMGGMIAQEMAIADPRRVSSLTSVMSNTGDRRHGLIHPTVLYRLIRQGTETRETAALANTERFSWWSGSAWDRDHHFEMAQRSVERSYRPRGVERQLAAIMSSGDRTKGLQSLSGLPALVIHGLADRLILPSGGIATARALAGSRLLMFDDMGHDLPPQRFDEIADAIQRTAALSSQP